MHHQLPPRRTVQKLQSIANQSYLTQYIPQHYGSGVIHQMDQCSFGENEISAT